MKYLCCVSNPGFTQPCPTGETWTTCAYRCDELCEYPARASGTCGNLNDCVPGCVPDAPTSCPPGQKRNEAYVCVPEALCPCLKPDGTIAMVSYLTGHY